MQPAAKTKENFKRNQITKRFISSLQERYC
ncbi:rCG44429 [Rattus norvegicus]|uniref:RCG44429 n=1 Tax=Rattus norvegicus TaxID=10116 RepID=A6I4H4_RAT|nr:rCG44429 [Rattus norvegicus]